MIEASGIPTLVIGTAHDIMSKVAPPRAGFVDYPVGRTFGPPNDRQRNFTVLARALAELANYSRPGEIHDLGCNWAPDGSRDWEDELRAEILHDH